MAMLLNRNIDALNSLSMLNQNRAAFQRDARRNLTVNSNTNDAFRPLSIINQNKTVAQKEVKRTSTITPNDNEAIDNVSAYTIEESLRIRTSILNQANQNIQDDTALLKTAQGRGNSIVDSIKEIQKLATTATDESLTDEDRLVIQRDINRLVEQISEDAQITFKGRSLIDGSASTGNQATATMLSNSALYNGTTADTALTALKNSNGTILGIETTDRITASYVQGGNIYTTSFAVGNNTLEDIFINLNKINGVSLRDTALVGGASNILTKPVEPPSPIAPPEPVAPSNPVAPIKPVEPEEVSRPVIPREFIPESAPEVGSYETGEEYEAAFDKFVADSAIYNAAQAGNVTIIEEDDPNYAAVVENYSAKTLEERTAEITAYNQYLDKKAVYDAAMIEYDKTYEIYADYIANNPDSVDDAVPTPTIAAYNRYVAQKDNYDSARADFKAKYEEFANYVANAPDQSAAYGNYATYLETAANSVDAERTGIVSGYSQYLRQNGNYSTESEAKAAYENYTAYLESYNKLVSQYQQELAEYDNLKTEYDAYKEDYYSNFLPQYQKDLADYNVMAAPIVNPDINGLSVAARKTGLDEQISGISINVTDNSGHTKANATAVLNNFKTTTFAEDAKEDNSVNFQIGETVGQTMNFGFSDMRAEAFGLKGKNGNVISIATKAAADASLATINNALSKANEQLQSIGSSEKKLGYIAESLAMEIGNIQEPDSMVRNAGMAKTLTINALDFFHRDRMQSMFAIANHYPSAVFALLR